MSSDERDDRRLGYRAPIELKVEYKRLNTFFADYTNARTIVDRPGGVPEKPEPAPA